MSEKILTESEVEEIAVRPAYAWVRFGDDPSESPHLPCGIALTPVERDALCATVKALRAEIVEFEKTDLVPRSRYNAADAESREAREMVKTVAERAKAEIDRLESRLSQVERERDELREQINQNNEAVK